VPAKRGHSALAPIGLAAALAGGVLLRLIWPADIEYKLDESWTVEQVRNLLSGAPWPWIGMPTSVGLFNPGMSIWVFAPLGQFSGARLPPELARAVQVLNVAALIGLVAFAWLCIPRERREPWLWAAALWAVNPLAVIFERKIWPPSVLPLGTVALTAAWWYRDRFQGAFAWGLIGALMSQVHLGAGFFVLALAAWTAMARPRAVNWAGWLSGSFLGALSALPWMLQLVGSHAEQWRWRLPRPLFYSRWFTQPFGFGSEYTLGRDHMREFLAGPEVAGQPTYLIGLLHAVLALLLLAVALRALARIYREGWPPLREVFVGEDPAGLLVRATLWGYGGMLTLITIAGVGSHRHYLIVAAPVMALWAAQTVLFCAEPFGRTAHRLLTAFALCEAAVSLGLLCYIHATQVIHGEYGPTWRSQQSHCPELDHARHSQCLKSLLGSR
jgi:hypothetical protein